MNSSRLSILPAVAVLFAITACSEDPRSPDLQPQIDRIEVCAAPETNICPSTDGSRSGCATSNAILAAGFSRQFCAYGAYRGISNDEINIPQTWQALTDGVLWESLIPAFASVDTDTGIVTAETEGDTQILATFDGVQGGTALRVTEPELVSIDISPTLLLTVPNVIRDFVCTGVFSNDACPGALANSCDVTNISEWVSQNPTVASVGNSNIPFTRTSKGVVTTENVGTTGISCTTQNQEGEDISATAAVRVCDATLDRLLLTVDGQVIDNTRQRTLVRNASERLGLRGVFTNQDENCGDIGLEFPVDVTQSAEWSVDRDGIVTVGNGVNVQGGLDGTADAKGEVRYVNPGLAEVAAEFGGSSISVPYVAVDANVVGLAVSGPQFMFAPGQYAFAATAQYQFIDPDSGTELPQGCTAGDSEGVFSCDVSTDSNIQWSTLLEDDSSAAGVADIFGNDGVVSVAVDAPPQIVTIAASFLGQNAERDALIVPATLTDIHVRPGLSCLNSGTLSLVTEDLLGITDPDLSVGGRSIDLELDLLYEVTLPGQEAQTCRFRDNATTDNAEIAVWGAALSDPVASNSGADLLDLLPNLINILAATGGLDPVAPAQSCLPLLPVGVVGDDEGAGGTLLTGSPVSVSNRAGERGRVTANQEALLGIVPETTVGTACVTAAVPNPRGGDPLLGSGTVLVAIDLLPDVCPLLEGLTDSLLSDGSVPDLGGLLSNTLFTLLFGEDPQFPEPDCLELLQEAGSEPGDGESGESGAGSEEGPGGLGALLEGLLGALTGRTR